MKICKLFAILILSGLIFLFPRTGHTQDAPGGIVIEIGSGYTKAGFLGEDIPQAVFPTVVGRSSRSMIGAKDAYVGDEALQKKGILKLTYPVGSFGEITNWDDYEAILNHIFTYELNVSPDEHPVIITEGQFMNKLQREKITQIMFEKFNVPYFYILNQATAEANFSGNETALIVECNYGETSFVPVYELYKIPDAIEKCTYGGKTLINYMSVLLTETGYSFTTSDELLQVEKMLKELCYVAKDFSTELANAQDDASSIEENFVLPDEQVITIGSPLFRSTECLFQPSLFGLQEKGIAESIQTSVEKCDADLRADMYSNIVLVGEFSLFPNFAERIETDLQKLVSSIYNISVKDLPSRENAAWIGTSIFASSSTFAGLWITSSEYQEEGAGIVHRKCPF